MVNTVNPSTACGMSDAQRTQANNTAITGQNENNANTIAHSQHAQGRAVTDVTHQNETAQHRSENHHSGSSFLTQIKSICNSIKNAFHAFENFAEQTSFYKKFEAFSNGLVGGFKSLPAELPQAFADNKTILSRLKDQSSENLIATGMQFNERHHIYSPDNKSFGPPTSAGLLMQYPQEDGAINGQFVMQELAKDSFLAKCITEQVTKDFNLENIQFLDHVQQHFLKDVNEPINRDSDSFDYTLDNLESLFSTYVLEGANKEINLSSGERKKLCKAYHSYIDALKNLDNATRQLDNAKDTQEQPNIGIVPVKIQHREMPIVEAAERERLSALNLSISENDPLAIQKQTVSDAKGKIDTCMKAAISTIGTLMNQSNSQLVEDLKRSVATSPELQKVVDDHFHGGAVTEQPDIGAEDKTVITNQASMSLANIAMPEPITKENNLVVSDLAAPMPLHSNNPDTHLKSSEPVLRV